MAISTSGDSGVLRHSLLHALHANWWLFLLRGVCAVLFGVLAFAWPGATLVTLVLLFGAYALLDGIFALIAALTGGGWGSRWWLAIVGFFGILAGVLTFVWPGVTTFVLLLFIAGWAMAMGIMQIAGAVQLRKEIENEWYLILSGLLSLAFGFLLFLNPGSGALALIFVIGAYALVFGVLLIFLGLRLRRQA